MCLAIPGRVEKIDGENALIDYDGIKKNANVSFVEVEVGDYVLVHVGFAIEKVDEKKAREMYSLLDGEDWLLLKKKKLTSILEVIAPILEVKFINKEILDSVWIK